jgi:GxxExxY protein
MNCHTAEAKETANALSRRIIGAAIEVHRELGPGLLESAYEACLCRELTLQGIEFERQVPLPVVYKGLELDCAYKLDIVVEELVVLELKAVEKLEAIHEAQLLTYLRLAHHWLGLLVNFNTAVLVNGIKRMVHG